MHRNYKKCIEIIKNEWRFIEKIKNLNRFLSKFYQNRIDLRPINMKYISYISAISKFSTEKLNREQTDK